jgi:hypothetical protein
MRGWARQIVQYLSDYALLWPGVLITTVGRDRAGRPGRPPAPGGDPGRLPAPVRLRLIASATLTPSRDALRFGAVGSGVCDLTRIGPVPLTDLLHFQDPAFNVALYVPLGIAIGMLPGGWARRWLIVAGLLLAPAIELTQLLVRPLGRACQTSDMSDNVTGLLIGLVAGWLVARAIGLGAVGTDPDQPSTVEESSAPAPDGPPAPPPRPSDG